MDAGSSRGASATTCGAISLAPIRTLFQNSCKAMVIPRVVRAREKPSSLSIQGGRPIDHPGRSGPCQQAMSKVVQKSPG